MPLMMLVPKFKASQFIVMWGMSTQALATESMVLGLATRSSAPKTVNRTFALTAPADSGLYMYFASPVSAGPVQFYDVNASFVGGWDGANDDHFGIYGPLTLDVLIDDVVVPYYVYRTDYADLGLCHWQTSPLVD